jgi:Ribbon-helix-helix domain
MRGPSIERRRQPKWDSGDRFTILFTVEQTQKLRALAASRRIPVSVLVREIVGKELDATQPEQADIA